MILYDSHLIRDKFIWKMRQKTDSIPDSNVPLMILTFHDFIINY